LHRQYRVRSTDQRHSVGHARLGHLIAQDDEGVLDLLPIGSRGYNRGSKLDLTDEVRGQEGDLPVDAVGCGIVFPRHFHHAFTVQVVDHASGDVADIGQKRAERIVDDRAGYEKATTMPEAVPVGNGTPWYRG